MQTVRLGFLVSLLLLPSAAAAQRAAVQPVLSESRGTVDFDLIGDGSWKVTGNALVLDEAGVPGGPIRKPAAIAILKGEPVGSFTLNAEVRSTAPVDLEVRDVLLIFGYQSPTQFYYVHISRKTDPVHNGIFVVDNADRKRLDTTVARAPLTDDAWHRVRLDRDVTTGRIALFFDAETTPVLSAVDRTLTTGRVGVGSFDETGEFRNLVLQSR